jgi:hypothetical protein
MTWIEREEDTFSRKTADQDFKCCQEMLQGARYRPPYFERKQGCGSGRLAAPALSPGGGPLSAYS